MPTPISIILRAAKSGHRDPQGIRRPIKIKGRRYPLKPTCAALKIESNMIFSLFTTRQVDGSSPPSGGGCPSLKYVAMAKRKSKRAAPQRGNPQPIELAVYDGDSIGVNSGGKCLYGQITRG